MSLRLRPPQPVIDALKRAGVNPDSLVLIIVTDKGAWVIDEAEADLPLMQFSLAEIEDVRTVAGATGGASAGSVGKGHFVEEIVADDLGLTRAGTDQGAFILDLLNGQS